MANDGSGVWPPTLAVGEAGRMGVKRSIDVVVSAVVLGVAAVPLAVLALLVRRDLGSPVLFRQLRPGVHGEPFTLVKLRTMRDGGGSDAERLTRLGRWLRESSVDEVPELWNVLKGDMSLVGPRPLLMEYLPLYSERQARRHEVRPGVTGLAQVAGRNTVSWEEKLELDVQYVEQRSLLLDLRVLARTVGLVVTRRGTTAEGHASMPPFEGKASRRNDDVDPEER
jgi:lipopolysaccharide/colanic/teichoic acid biosynthesis glycosyltransferase